MVSESYKNNEFTNLIFHYNLKDGKAQKYLLFNSRRIANVFLNRLYLKDEADDNKYLYSFYKETNDDVIKEILYRLLVMFIVSTNPGIVKSISLFADIHDDLKHGCINYCYKKEHNKLKIESWYFKNEYNDRYDFVINDCIFKVFYNDSSLPLFIVQFILCR